MLVFASAIPEPVEGTVIGKVDGVNTNMATHNVIGLEYEVPIAYLMQPSEDGIQSIDPVRNIVSDYVQNYHRLPADPRSMNREIRTFATLPKTVELNDVTEEDIVVMHERFIWIFSKEADLKYAIVTTEQPLKTHGVTLRADVIKKPCGGQICVSAEVFVNDEILELTENQPHASRHADIDSVSVFHLRTSKEPGSSDEIGYVVGFADHDSVATSFTDVPSSHPYFEAIEYAKKQKLIQGYEDGTFRPDSPINRAELTKILVASEADVDTLTTCLAVRAQLVTFQDLVPGAWYVPFICTAKLLGWIDGYEDGGFRPDRTVSVVEAAKITVNALGIEAQRIPGSEWYMRYYRALADRGAIAPSVRSYDHRMTRGEFAFMMHALR